MSRGKSFRIPSRFQLVVSESGIVTFLFTDLVNSTQHLQAVGDEAPHQLFRGHHKLLTDAVNAAGGQELEWLGDGILAAFSSAADAVRCAMQVQQTARRPAADADFAIRIGIHTGERLDEAERRRELVGPGQLFDHFDNR